ncbi:hypothetical protein K469DRAFT_712365, partial [Zopfia rhizophila CBS 207.26]
MRLLRTKTLKLSEFLGSNIPPYAILFYTWGAEEVSFNDMNGDRETTLTKAGYRKIRQCCEKALLDGYQNSAVCYAYLAGVLSREKPILKNIAFA